MQVAPEESHEVSRVKRVLYRTATLLALISFILNVLVVGLWIVSSFRHDRWYIETKYSADPYWRSERSEVQTGDGRLYVVKALDAQLPLSEMPTVQLGGEWIDTDHKITWTSVTRSGVRWESGAADKGINRTSVGMMGVPGTVDQYRVHKGYATFILECKTWALWSSVLPFIWFIYWARGFLEKKERRSIGKCVNCGYDLCATPERCPECGLVPDGTRTNV